MGQTWDCPQKQGTYWEWAVGRDGHRKFWEREEKA